MDIKTRKKIVKLSRELSTLYSRFNYWNSKDKKTVNTDYWIDHLAWEIGLKKQEIEVVKNGIRAII